MNNTKTLQGGKSAKREICKLIMLGIIRCESRKRRASVHLRSNLAQSRQASGAR